MNRQEGVKVSMMALTIVLIGVSFLAEDRSYGQTSEAGKPASTARKAVYPEPPAEELARITHPKIRKELLEMVYVDQQARLRGG